MPQVMPPAEPENDVQQIGVQTDKRTRWLIGLAVMVSDHGVG
jgi:hypothetical protein